MGGIASYTSIDKAFLNGFGLIPILYNTLGSTFTLADVTKKYRPIAYSELLDVLLSDNFSPTIKGKN